MNTSLSATAPIYVDNIWKSQGSAKMLRNLALAIAGSALLTISAKIQVPLIVPMTLQSLVVLVLAASFGMRLGLATVALYLLEGALGLPVFAGTPEKGVGILYMMGPTGGYLAGFIVATAVVGYLAEKGFTKSIIAAFAVMLLGHILMIGMGFGWLATLMGAEKAYLIGVVPFFAATAIKTALGAAILPASWALVNKIRG